MLFYFATTVPLLINWMAREHILLSKTVPMSAVVVVDAGYAWQEWR